MATPPRCPRWLMLMLASATAADAQSFLGSLPTDSLETLVADEGLPRVWAPAPPPGFQSEWCLPDYVPLEWSRPPADGQCTPFPDSTVAQDMLIMNMNCWRVGNASSSLSTLANQYWSSSLRTGWENRSSIALACCALAQGQIDPDYAAKYALTAWSVYIMTNRECCNFAEPPFCGSSEWSRLARFCVAFSAVLVIIVAGFLSPWLLKRSKSVWQINFRCEPLAKYATKKHDPQTAAQPYRNTIHTLQDELELAQELLRRFQTSSFQSLDDCREWGVDAAAVFAGLYSTFGFQRDNVRNMFEHFLSFWRSHCAVVADRKLRNTDIDGIRGVEGDLLGCGLDELHKDLLNGLDQWRQREGLPHVTERPVGGARDRAQSLQSQLWSEQGAGTDQRGHPNTDWKCTNAWASTGPRQSTNASRHEELLELATFLLVWGEAGNLRFMPEVIIFITEMALAAGAKTDPVAVYNGLAAGKSGPFLAHIVRPIYKVCFDTHYESTTGNGKKMKLLFDRFLPADCPNYDDWNEMFLKKDWLKQSLKIGWNRQVQQEHEKDGLVNLSAGSALLGLDHTQWYGALPYVDWAAAFAQAKTHRELHSIAGAFAATHRVWFLHALLFWFSVWWATTRDFAQEVGNGSPVLLGGNSSQVCLAALGLLVPLHAFVWKLCRFFLKGREGFEPEGVEHCCSHFRSFSTSVFSFIFWSLPVVTYGLVRFEEIFGPNAQIGVPSKQKLLTLEMETLLAIHFTISFFGAVVILVFPNYREDSLWTMTETEPLWRLGRWTFWIAVMGVKVYLGLNGISALNTAVKNLAITRPGREPAGDLLHVAFGPTWDKDMVMWLAVQGVGFVVFCADTQYWFSIGCTVLGVIVAFSHRGWRFVDFLQNNDMAQVPTRFSKHFLPPAHDNQGRPVNISPWFPGIWKKIYNFMKYEDKITTQWKNLLAWQGEDTGCKWEDLMASVVQASEQPAKIFKEKALCERYVETIGAANNSREELNWRLDALKRSLSMDMEEPFRAPYIPGFSVMIPHYGESILLQYKELFRAAEGAAAQEQGKDEQVYLIDWLTTRYNEEFGSFCARNEDHLPQTTMTWETYNTPQYKDRIEKWASMRSQTLWRTVTGMMMYLPALECHHDTHSVQGSRLGWDVDEVFTCVVTMQVFAQFQPHQRQHAEELLKKYKKCLRIAYIDSQNKETEVVLDDGTRVNVAQDDNVHPNQDKRFYSVLINQGSLFSEDGVDADRKMKFKNNEKIEPLFEIELPGLAILGDGKGDNQNHAVIFTRGSIIQTIDANQGAYFEQMLLLPSILGEFRKPGGGIAPKIVGLPEHITSDIGSVGDFAAGAEVAFGTTLQRSYAWLGARMHYGHPDLMNKEFMIQQGGVSKATKTVNLSEDIFAGMDFTLRGNGRQIVHREYFAVSKGRDMGFGTVLGFFMKLSAGTGEQVLSRQTFRLGQLLDLPEYLTFYYGHVGFYITQFLLSKSVPLLVFIWLLVVLDDPESNFMASFRVVNTDAESGAEAIAKLLGTVYSMLMLLFIVAQTAPLFMEIWLEAGFFAGFMRVFKQIVTLAPLHFVFQAKVIGIFITNEISFGGATYIATGRGLPIDRKPFIENYQNFAGIALYDGARLLAATVMVGLAGGFNVDAELRNKLVWWMVALGLTIVSWLYSPFIFNPLQFRLKGFTDDLEDLKKFFFLNNGESWVHWYTNEQRKLMGLKAKPAPAAGAVFPLDRTLRDGSDRLEEVRGIRASPFDVAIWVLFIASWYTVLNSKIHLLTAIFAGSTSILLSTVLATLCPPVVMSFAVCSVVQYFRSQGKLDNCFPRAALSLLVALLDLGESLLELWKPLEVKWWKSVVCGLMLKYALLSLTLQVVEILFRMKKEEPQNQVFQFVKKTARTWLHAHRMAFDILVSGLIFSTLIVFVIISVVRVNCLPSYSFHNFMIYRDFGPPAANRGEEEVGQITRSFLARQGQSQGARSSATGSHQAVHSPRATLQLQEAAPPGEQVYMAPPTHTTSPPNRQPMPTTVVSHTGNYATSTVRTPLVQASALASEEHHLLQQASLPSRDISNLARAQSEATSPYLQPGQPRTVLPGDGYQTAPSGPPHLR